MEKVRKLCWRPAVGVLAIGAIAIGLTLQGAWAGASSVKSSGRSVKGTPKTEGVKLAPRAESGKVFRPRQSTEATATKPKSNIPAELHGLYVRPGKAGADVTWQPVGPEDLPGWAEEHAAFQAAVQAEADEAIRRDSDGGVATTTGSCCAKSMMNQVCNCFAPATAATCPGAVGVFLKGVACEDRTDCDCDGNLQCDLFQTTQNPAQDCNSNNLPDICDGFPCKACCVGANCVSDELPADCTALGGTSHPHASCAGQASLPPPVCNVTECAWDNGVAPFFLDDGGALRAHVLTGGVGQLPRYNFQAVDDFIIPGTGANGCKVTDVIVWMRFRPNAPSVPVVCPPDDNTQGPCMSPPDVVGGLPSVDGIPVSRGFNVQVYDDLSDGNCALCTVGTNCPTSPTSCDILQPGNVPDVADCSAASSTGCTRVSCTAAANCTPFGGGACTAGFCARGRCDNPCEAVFCTSNALCAALGLGTCVNIVDGQGRCADGVCDGCGLDDKSPGATPLAPASGADPGASENDAPGGVVYARHFPLSGPNADPTAIVLDQVRAPNEHCDPFGDFEDPYVYEVHINIDDGIILNKNHKYWLAVQGVFPFNDGLRNTLQTWWMLSNRNTGNVSAAYRTATYVAWQGQGQVDDLQGNLGNCPATCQFDSDCGSTIEDGNADCLAGVCQYVAPVVASPVAGTRYDLAFQIQASKIVGNPANNECATMVTAFIGSTPFTTVGASDSVNLPAAPAPCDTIDNDLWYEVAVPLDGVLQIDTCGSTFDTKLEVYLDADGTCAGATHKACSNDDGSLCTPADNANRSLAKFVVNAGENYFIRVGGHNNATGKGILNISLTPLCGQPESPACCLPDSCTTNADCEANGWGTGVDCIGNVCLGTSNQVGCQNVACCEAICDLDPACCNPAIGYDDQCAGLADGEPVCQCPCDLTCPMGATQEVELCNGDLNGGCNSMPAVYQAITCGSGVTGASFCGTLWADGDARDLDWLSFTVTDTDMSGSDEVTLLLNSDIPTNLTILDVDDCDNLLAFAGVSTSGCDPFMVEDVCLPSGNQYAIVAGTGSLDFEDIFNGFPCPTMGSGQNSYTLTLSGCNTACGTGACCSCTGACFDGLNGADCFTMHGNTSGAGGAYLGNGTTCALDGAACPAEAHGLTQATPTTCNSSQTVNLIAATNPADESFTCGNDGNNPTGCAWFSFTACTQSALIQTVNSNPLTGRDSLVAIYDVTGNTLTCPLTVTEIGETTGDDRDGCGDDEGGASGFLSRFCVTGLVNLRTYYVQVCNWNEFSLGEYLLEIVSPCTGACCDNLLASCTSPTDVAACIALANPTRTPVFRPGQSCVDAFDPPCGLGACCNGDTLECDVIGLRACCQIVPCLTGAMGSNAGNLSCSSGVCVAANGTTPCPDGGAGCLCRVDTVPDCPPNRNFFPEIACRSVACQPFNECTYVSGQLSNQRDCSVGLVAQYGTDTGQFTEMADNFTLKGVEANDCGITEIRFNTFHSDQQAPCVAGGGGGCSDQPDDYYAIHVSISPDDPALDDKGPTCQPTQPVDGTHTCTNGSLTCTEVACANDAGCGPGQCGGVAGCTCYGGFCSCGSPNRALDEVPEPPIWIRMDDSRLVAEAAPPVNKDWWEYDITVGGQNQYNITMHFDPPIEIDKNKKHWLGLSIEWKRGTGGYDTVVCTTGDYDGNPIQVYNSLGSMEFEPQDPAALPNDMQFAVTGEKLGGCGTGQKHGDVTPYPPSPNSTGVVDLDDILCILGGFSDPVNCPKGNIVPCGVQFQLKPDSNECYPDPGASVIDLDDILSVLGAFSGDVECNDPCPIAKCCTGSSCSNLSKDDCSAAGGVWSGVDCCGDTRAPGTSPCTTCGTCP